MSRDPSLARAAWILGLITAAESVWIVINAAANPAGFARFLGMAPGLTGAPFGWALAAVTTALFVLVSLRLPSVRENLVRLSFLKLLALALGVAAGILEEAVFRKLVMDGVAHAGYGSVLQVLASSLGFGAAHAIWGLFGGHWRAALGAMLATSFLGFLLALVYLAAGRSLLPCIVAHFLIDAFIEPGLVLAALRGEMNRGRPQTGAPGRSSTA